MNNNKAVTAHFVATYTITITVTPTGGGTVSRSPNSASYESGASVTVTATAASGYTFAGWSGSSWATSGSVTITMSGNSTLTANFFVSPTVTSGTFYDSRNSKTYKTVKINNQTWMAENLNYPTDSSWCYGNADSNCVKYGRLYGWNAAMSACPPGWHLPTRQEWGELATATGGIGTNGSSGWAGKNLKATSGWNGTDNYGFSALPGGYRYTNGSFHNAGYDSGYWWTATEGESSGAYGRDIYSYYVFMSEYATSKSVGNSVRCVQD
jgi:uncharacterized protein (TIGR02145 family)/uncharacterized repeat protein (TIGR02543 family)